MQRRLPYLVTAVLAVLVLAGALVDPVGFFAPYGSPGRLVPETRWQAAPLLVQVPLLLAGVFWTTRTFVHLPRRRRFASVWAGIVLASLVAKFAMSAVATAPLLNLADLAWATSYTVLKAALYALPPAALALLGRRPDPVIPPAPRGAWWVAGAVVVAGALAGSGWGRGLPEGVPSVSASGGAAGLAGGLVVLLAGTGWAQRAFARRARDGAGVFLGGWLAALWGGAVLGLAQTVVLVFVDGFGSALRTPAVLYLRVCEGVSLGAAVGWTGGLAALYLARRLRDPLPVGAGTRSATAGAALLVAAGAVVAAGVGGGAAGREVPAGRVAGDALLPLSAVRGKDARIVDSAGRQVLLRGVNVNQLVDFYAARPEVPATRPLTEADFAEMARLGFNVVRLGFSWSKAEPLRGSYDQAYLGRIDEAVALAAKHGLYTVLDLHQDGWSNAATPKGTRCPAGTSAMSGYDGAPAWATFADGAPRCQFTGRDLSPAGDRAFTNFYYDREGIQTRLVALWGMLAARYGDDPAVAGFDPMNEPGFGEQAPLTSTLLLGRFYDRVLTAVREAETRRHLLFFEPSIFWSGLGFDAVPRGSFTDDPDLVFSPHLYAESITMDSSLGLPPITDLEHGFTLAGRLAGDLPVWSGEWGYWGDRAVVQDRLRRYARAEDAHRLGGAFWVWKQACGDPQNGDGPVGDAFNKVDCATGKDLPRDPVAVAELSRAHPRAVPGTLTSLRATGRALRLTGTAGRGDCALDVWVPGEARPALSGTNTSALDARRVEGGWRVAGCATGRYVLEISG